MHENALKSILEFNEISENETPTISKQEYDNKTEEIPLSREDHKTEEEIDYTQFGFDDPFFTKLGLGQSSNSI